MKNIQSIELNDSSKEELLPGFSADFPYIATCAELDRYLEPLVPWHWHPTVELFYMKSGSLEYTTPHGKWIFSAGSGGFVNANVLHQMLAQTELSVTEISQSCGMNNSYFSQIFRQTTGYTPLEYRRFYQRQK